MEEKIRVWFDKRGDYLEVLIGKFGRTHFDSIDGTDAYRIIDSKSGRVVGFACINFSKQFEMMRGFLELPTKSKLLIG